MFFFTVRNLQNSFSKISWVDNFFSSLIKLLFIFNPLFAIALLASFLEDMILLSDKKSKSFIPFFTSLV